MKSALTKLLRRALNAGVTTGPTFHLEIDPGVGLLIVPNARLSRMQCNVVAIPDEVPRKVDGVWIAKPLHVTDKFLGV